MIELKKDKPNFKQMFDNFLKESKKIEDKKTLYGSKEYLQYLIEKYGDEDEYEFPLDNFGYEKSKKAWKKTRKLLENFTTKKKNKSSKRGKRGSKKNKNVFDEEDMKYDVAMNEKTIYFYRDYNDPDRCEVFFTLHDFDNFLEEEGINVSEEEVRNLMSREISHCCVNPDIKATHGNVELITDNSYGGLYWSCNQDEETYSLYT